MNFHQVLIRHLPMPKVAEVVILKLATVLNSANDLSIGRVCLRDIGDGAVV